MPPPRFRPDRPFQALPKLPPKPELETPTVLKACISARAALAELNAVVELVPNPTIVINTIPILEAQASSEIENIVTTADRLFRFASDDVVDLDPATKEALRYRTALKQGFDRLETRPVSTNLAVELCATLRGIQTAVRKVPGTTLRDLRTGAVVYTPPDGEDRLRQLLANWEAFLHGQEDLDPLTRMAVGHYQFEAIHPFEDGNGRTGRILNLLFIIERHLLRTPILYMSRAILANKSDYYRLLLDVSASGRWEPWLLYMLKVVDATSVWTTAKVRAIGELFTRATAHVRQYAPKIYSHELVKVIFEQPYCRIENVVDARIAKRQTASDYLATLADIGVLEPAQAGREKLFIHRALFNLLTSEAHEARHYLPPTGPRLPLVLGSRRSAPKTAPRSREAESMDEQLRFAIANKRLIELTYSGSTRVVEPHDYGVHKGLTRLLGYQHRGTSSGGRKSLSGWRLFDVAKIERCAVLEETFRGSRGDAHQHHYVWDPLHARVG